MKLFQLVQKYYRTIGVHPTLSNPKCPFNLRNSWLLLIASAFFASTVSSFVQSTTIMDFAESFYIFSTVLASMISYLETISKADKTFTFIGELDEYIQKSGFAFNKQFAMRINRINCHFLPFRIAECFNRTGAHIHQTNWKHRIDDQNHSFWFGGVDCDRMLFSRFGHHTHQLFLFRSWRRSIFFVISD